MISYLTTLLQYRLGFSLEEVERLSNEEWAEKIAQLEHIIQQEKKANGIG